MITKEQKERINELYKKKQEVGLTEDEKKEQEQLRRLYIDSMKESLRSQLDSIKIVTPEEYEKQNHKECSKDGCHCHEHKH